MAFSYSSLRAFSFASYSFLCSALASFHISLSFATWAGAPFKSGKFFCTVDRCS